MKLSPRAWILVCAASVVLTLSVWISRGEKSAHDARSTTASTSASTTANAPAALAQKTPHDSAAENSAGKTQAQIAPAPKPDAFRLWLAGFEQADESGRAKLLPAGRELAVQRRLHMARLIRENPSQALDEALRLHEYAALPADLQALVERPFSAAVAYDNYPVCGAPAGMPDHLARLQLPEGEVAACTYGRRDDLMSKRSIPVQGIALDGAAAVSEHALRELEPAELATARALFPEAQSDPSRSFLDGKLIGDEPVIALGGGRLYHFATREELARLNAALAELDALPGPFAGSDVLYHYQAAPASGASPASGTTGPVFDLSAAQSMEQTQASAWTEQPKRVFIIRVDFSDVPGASHTQAATADVLNTTVSDQVRAMSYGKTWIIAGVSANTYRMPSTAAYYVNGAGPAESLNSDLLRDARNTFRNTRSGGDATVNIGPVSLTGNGDAGGLGDYDIVGVLFNMIQMRSSIVYGGLAGGGNIWMQGTISKGTFTHELGHNYGLGHSSFWQTSDGSVTGAGSSVEYGDDYDIMGGGDVPQGHFHPQGKSRLNWLTSTEWSDATALGSATYRLYRIDNSLTTGTPRGVRITRSATPGSEQYLWLGYRPAYTGMPYLENGAYMVWQRPGQTRSWLIDATPATSGNLADAPVALGRTYADTTSGAFVTPVAKGGSGAEAYLDVRVNFGPFPGNAAPVLGALNGPASVAARTATAYSLASASDPNGDTLAFGWDSGTGDIPPNSSVVAPSWTVGGNYTVSVVVSDMKGGTTTATRSITVTDPLDSWTVGSAGTTDDLRRVIYAQGRYLAADYWGDSYLSWDGVSWSFVGQPTDMDQPEFASGSGLFVAAGVRESNSAQGQISWSPDGRRWRQANFPLGSPPLRTVAYGNGRFVAAGDDGAVLVSTDGVNWTLGTVATAPDFSFLSWTGTTWIAVAMHPVNARAEVVWTSSDALTWTQRASLGVSTDSIFTRNGVCYALGWYAGVLYSTDQGVTWLGASLPGGTRWSTSLMAAAPDGTLVCTALAMDESGTPGAVLVSTDGVRWVRKNGNTELGNVSALIFGDGRFLAVENAGVTRRSDTFYPGNSAPAASFATAPATAPARQPVYLSASGSDANGDTLTYAWDFGTQTDVLSGAEIAPTIDFGGSYTITLRVSDGRGGLTTLSRSLTVTDPARTFTNRSVAVAGNFQAIAAGGGRVVAVGSQMGGTFTGPRAWSTDGITWNTGNLGDNRHLYGLVHDGVKFVGAGTQYDFAAPAGWRGWIATSTDGVTWTDRYFAGAWLNTIAYGGGIYLAAGESGSLLRSTDGTTWSAVAIPGVGSTIEFSGLAWNGSVFLLTGYTGGNGGVKVFTSTNGTNWMDQAAGAGVASWQDMRGAAWLNDRFVASGWYSKLRVSTDGGATFTSTRADSEETPALAYGAGIYLASGVNRSASSADVDLLSRDGVTWSSFAAPTTNDRRAAIFFNNTFITVGDAGSIWQSGTVTAPSGFAAWQTTQFPAGGLNALATADPDNDGLNNLTEYALDLPPLTPSPSPGAALIQSSRVSFGVSLPEPARSDVTYRVQGRSSLTTGIWTELARKTGTGAWSWQSTGAARISTGAVSGGKVPLVMGQPDDQLGQPSYFLRLLIEAP